MYQGHLLMLSDKGWFFFLKCLACSIHDWEMYIPLKIAKIYVKFIFVYSWLAGALEYVTVHDSELL